MTQVIQHLKTSLLLTALLLLCGCKLLHPPVISAIAYPLWQPCNDSASIPAYAALISENREALKQIRIGLVRNPFRSGWDSKVDSKVLDLRRNEATSLKLFLDELNCFKEVVIVKTVGEQKLDYYIQATGDCIYSVELDSPMYFFNSFTLFLGFLLGYPYEDSSASYVLQANFYSSGPNDESNLLGSSLASNHRIWMGDNIYWRPKFYSADNFAPCYKIMLFDFLRQSGSLDR